MAEENAFNLPNGDPIRSAWSRVIRNQKVALRKLLDNARFANASIVSDRVTQALRIWRKDFGQFADELSGRMVPYMSTIITRSGNVIRTRQGFAKADDWFIRDSRRVEALKSTVLELCYDTLESIAGEADMKVEQVRAKLIAGELDQGKGGWTDLYTSLDKFFDEGAVWRAARIARTEASRAANWGIREAAEELDDCIGFEWLMAPGACQACQTAGKNVNGMPKRVAKGQPFVRNLGPKVTNLGDELRERTIPEEYRQISFPPLHPHDRCSLKPIFKPVDGSTVEFDKPLDMGGNYLANSEEIDPVNLNTPVRNSGIAPVKPTRSSRIPLVKPGKLKKPRKQRAAKPIKEVKPVAIQQPDNSFVEFVKVNQQAFKSAELIQSGLNDKKTRWIDLYISPDQVFERYKVGDAKIKAITEYAEKYAPQDYKTLSDEMEKENLYSDSNQKNKARIEEIYKKQEVILDKIREDIFELIKVESSEQQPIVDSTRKAKPKTIKPELERVVKPMLKNFSKALGKPRLKDSVCAIDVRYNGRLTNFNGICYTLGGQIEIKNIRKSTIAHEIGHAISWNNGDLLSDGKTINFLKPNNAIAEKYLAKFLKAKMASVNPDVLKKVRSCNKNTGRSIESENKFYFYQYSQTRKSYSEGIEVPSVLMDFFYHDPVAFTRFMPAELTKTVLGLLDGTFR